MTYIEYGTWEEQADHCYKITYNSKVNIVTVYKSEDDSKWLDDLKDSVYLSSNKFPTKADAYHYLKGFVKSDTLEDVLRTKIEEFINSEPKELTHILDYIEL
jgi:hypothetical protein